MCRLYKRTTIVTIRNSRHVSNRPDQKCKQNDRKAQMELYTQYCDAMYSVALRYVKNEDDAEDVVQEAFIKAFRKLDQYRAEVAFGAWLKRIVINKSIDFLKTREDEFGSYE